MTLGEAITMVLNRVGLDTTNADFKNEARNYINLTAAEIAALVDWWWLDRTTSFLTTDTLTVSGGSGTFVEGETITGGTSGEAGTGDGEGGRLPRLSEGDIRLQPLRDIHGH